jgi:hypothetical protein
METITKPIDSRTQVIFDVENSDHGDSGFQWYYGTLILDGIEYPFSICVMHDSNSGTQSYDLTFTEDIPSDIEQNEEKILGVFDWEEINDEHEQNEIELEKTMDKCRDENWD